MFGYKCPVCGKETQYIPKFQGLCLDCFIKTRLGESLNGIESIKIDGKICPICGRISFNGSWYFLSKKLIEKRILGYLKDRVNLKSLGKISIEVVLNDDNILDIIETEEINGNFALRLEENILKQGIFTIKLKKKICPSCTSKAAGKYFESIIHIRLNVRTKDELRMKKKLIREIILSKVNDPFVNIKTLRNGFDVRLSDKVFESELLKLLSKNFTNIKINRYSTKKKTPDKKKIITINHLSITL